MKNIKVTMKGSIAHFEVDTSKNHGQSKSGKSTVIASSEGNVSIPGNDSIKFGLNVYTKT